MLAIELGLDDNELVRDNFDERMERLDERNKRVSFSEMGDGPGSGGRGAEGGKEGGGLPGNVAEEVEVGI
jgi:hypothetical protein